jgi:predicted RNase H-like nuclease
VVTVEVPARPSSDHTRPARVDRVSDLREVLAELRAGTLSVLGIDMPMGLPEAGVRASDAALRRFLRHRHSSVFSTPPRSVLSASTYPEALAVARSVDGRGLSKQTFHLLPKIREVDALIDASVQPAVIEVHPESSFAAMAGAPLDSRKKEAAGRLERRTLLGQHFAGLAPTAVPARGRTRHDDVDDDVLDAYAAAWTARRVVRGEATIVGDADARDGRGLRMIVAI